MRACNLSSRDLCEKDDSGSTLLHLVIKRGDIDAEKCLVGKLPLEGLRAEDNKMRTPMHLAARCKSKKMFGVLFARIINELGADQAVGELFKTSNRSGSVFACGYLRKHRDFAALLNNSKVQISTVFVQGRNMFKAILDTLPVRLDLEQMNTIVSEIDAIEESCIISKQHGAKLRGIVWNYIEQQYRSDSDKVIQYVSYKRHLAYIKERYGSRSKHVIEYVTQRRKLIAYIEAQYGCVGTREEVATGG